MKNDDLKKFYFKLFIFEFKVYVDRFLWANHYCDSWKLFVSKMHLLSFKPSWHSPTFIQMRVVWNHFYSVKWRVILKWKISNNWDGTIFFFFSKLENIFFFFKIYKKYTITKKGSHSFTVKGVNCYTNSNFQIRLSWH